MNLLASLRYLVALHEHRHFGRAAQRLHEAQQPEHADEGHQQSAGRHQQLVSQVVEARGMQRIRRVERALVEGETLATAQALGSSLEAATILHFSIDEGRRLAADEGPTDRRLDVAEVVDERLGLRRDRHHVGHDRQAKRGLPVGDGDRYGCCFSLR